MTRLDLAQLKPNTAMGPRIEAQRLAPGHVRLSEPRRRVAGRAQGAPVGPHTAQQAHPQTEP